MTQFSLSYRPGRGSPFQRYSNLIYCILQQIVTAASGQRYRRCVRNQILRPADVTAMMIGCGRLAERASDEVMYYDQTFADPRPLPYPQDTTDMPQPFTHVVESMAGHGGWIDSANDLVRCGAFKPTGPGGATTFFGSINATRSMLKQ